MANKLIDITDSVNKYDILSQTPKNYNKDNYFIKELQDKVNAEWTYRPNRVDIEFEEEWGNEEYTPIEVVVQKMKSDKGEDISNDCKRIVFKDIREDRFKIGSRFRFSKNFHLSDPEKMKDVWLTTNFNATNLTSAVTIERCNGTIGSTYEDSQGITHLHYEPVIQGRELQGTTLRYADPIVSPQSQLIITCQHNWFTRQYYINQRFVIGYNEQIKKAEVYLKNNYKKAPKWRNGYFYERIVYDGYPSYELVLSEPDNWNELTVCNQYYHLKDTEKSLGSGKVYRITAINKFYADSTYCPESVGLMRIYLELTESSVYDDFQKRIAYQNESTVTPKTTENDFDYNIGFLTPEYIPTELTSVELMFTPILRQSDGSEFDHIPIHVSLELERLPNNVSISEYVNFNNDEENGTFTLSRKDQYLNGDLIVTCYIDEVDSPTGEQITTSFKLSMTGW